MNIYNNVKPLSRLCISYCTYILPKLRCRNLSTVAGKYNRCQKLPWHSPEFVSAQQRHNVFSFQCYSDTDSELNHLSKDEPTEDNSTDKSTRDQGFSQGFSLEVLVALLKQENALDLCVIKVPEQVKYAEYFIVVSGLSPRHLSAMALYAIKVYKHLKKKHEPNAKVEGKSADDWMCIDFGNIVVHFMLQEARDVYELEKLWTLRTFDEQLKSMPEETIPKDFIFDLEDSQETGK